MRDHPLSGLAQLSRESIHDLLTLCKNHMGSSELAPPKDSDPLINPRVFHLFEHRLFDRQKEMVLIPCEVFSCFLLLLEVLCLLLLVESVILSLSTAGWLRYEVQIPVLRLLSMSRRRISSSSCSRRRNSRHGNKVFTENLLEDIELSNGLLTVGQGMRSSSCGTGWLTPRACQLLPLPSIQR